MNRCKNCYWYRFEDIIWGYCWRFPPKKIVDKLFPKIKERQRFWEAHWEGYIGFTDMRGQWAEFTLHEVE